jgi:hypothetical protein
MAKYGKLLSLVGAIVLPMVITGIRSLLKKRRGNQETIEEGDSASNRDVLDTLVDVGLSGLTGGGKGRGK